MSECSCIYVGVDEMVEMIKESHVESARNEHECSECGTTIQKGSPYDRHFYKYDGKTSLHKFCQDCISLRDVFFCDGWFYGKIREAVTEHVGEVEGQFSSDCILSLTAGAREFVLDEIQEVFDELNLGEEENDIIGD